MTESEEELKSLLMKGKEESEKIPHAVGQLSPHTATTEAHVLQQRPSIAKIKTNTFLKRSYWLKCEGRKYRVEGIHRPNLINKCAAHTELWLWTQRRTVLYSYLENILFQIYTKIFKNFGQSLQSHVAFLSFLLKGFILMTVREKCTTTLKTGTDLTVMEFQN